MLFSKWEMIDSILPTRPVMTLKCPRRSLMLFVVLFHTISIAAEAAAACDLKITSVTTCDSKGNLYHPKVGDTYYIRVDWTVTGTPNAKYNVQFSMANQKWL